MDQAAGDSLSPGLQDSSASPHCSQAPHLGISCHLGQGCHATTLHTQVLPRGPPGPQAGHPPSLRQPKGRPGVSGPWSPELRHLWGAQGDSHVEVIRCRVLGAPVCPSGLLSKARQGHLPQSHCGKREVVGWGLPHGKPAGSGGLARTL